MEKIFTFIINEYNELLLLKGSPSDPQFHKSLWYVVTGGIEKQDITKEDAVIREIYEETALTPIKVTYLNWIFKYKSLGKECIEYVYMSEVKKERIILNEENIDYKWLNLKDFIDQIDWFYNKEDLTNVLTCYLNNQMYFENEKE
jgi:8-oxo-dGTP pyrophosphatase MutT (NUDIX family)